MKTFCVFSTKNERNLVKTFLSFLYPLIYTTFILKLIFNLATLYTHTPPPEQVKGLKKGKQKFGYPAFSHPSKDSFKSISELSKKLQVMISEKLSHISFSLIPHHVKE